MKFIVTDTDLGIEIARFDSKSELAGFMGTIGQDGALKVSSF
jgi:hypothetical protein